MASRLLFPRNIHDLRSRYSDPGFMRRWNEYQAADVQLWTDDFLGDTLNGTYQVSAATSGSNPAIDTGQASGRVAFDAGSSDNGSSCLSLGLHYYGQFHCAMECKIQFSAVTSLKFEIGFTDVVAGTDDGAVSALATPTWTADDAALWCFDTDDTAYPQLLGVKATAASAKVEPTVTISASTYYSFGIEIVDTAIRGTIRNAAGALIYDSERSNKTLLASAMTANTLLTPWVYVQNRSATQRIGYMDYLEVVQYRATTL